jgi:hypothetical protein
MISLIFFNSSGTSLPLVKTQFLVENTGAKILSIMTLSILILGMMKFNVMTLSIMILSTMTLSIMTALQYLA